MTPLENLSRKIAAIRKLARGAWSCLLISVAALLVMGTVVALLATWLWPS